jgi:hypothetical protein
MDKYIKELSEKLNKKLDQNCEHDFKICGKWDGVDSSGKWIYGDILVCKKCGSCKNESNN